MKVTGSICHYDNEKEIVFDKVNLVSFVATGNYISIGNHLFRVAETMFMDKKTVTDYLYFEQLIVPIDNHSTLPIPFPKHLLFKGKIEFDDKEEIKYMREISIHNNDLPHFCESLYTFLRRYDCIKIRDGIFLCDKVVIKDSVELVITVFNSPITIENFRSGEYVKWLPY